MARPREPFAKLDHSPPIARYGFRFDPDGPKDRLGRPTGLLPDPEEMAVVGRMVALRRAGLSQEAIADRLTADGVPTRSGQPAWGASVVRHALFFARSYAESGLLPDETPDHA